MDEVKVRIQAIIDAKDVQARLNAIKNLSVKIEKLNFSQVQNQATEAGLQIGQKIESGINSFMQKGNSKNTIGGNFKEAFSELIDIDTVLADLNIAGENRKPLDFLNTKQVNAVLTNYNKALDKGAEATAKFINAGTGNDFLNGFLNDLNSAPATMDKYNDAVKSAQAAQNELTASMVASKIASMAMNAAISMGLSIAISGLVKVIDNLVHANDKAIESAEELKKKYSEAQDANVSNISTLKNLQPEFDELSKGVSQYGGNISLTADEFERYKEIIRQIVGMSPSLSEGYSTENGYITDKNGLLERAIELQEQEYKNELRKKNSLEGLKTAMSGYIAEYKQITNGDILLDEDGTPYGGTAFQDLERWLHYTFNDGDRNGYDSLKGDLAREIIASLGIEDVEGEIQKYYANNIFNSSAFFSDYMDTISQNIDLITKSIDNESVGLDKNTFDINIQKLDEVAKAYADKRDFIASVTNDIQKDLGFIAEGADKYSALTSEQQKFVSDYLEGFDISDISSKNGLTGKLQYDEDKMLLVKNQIIKFVENLSEDSTTKEALKDLYAPPADDESVTDYVNRMKSAMEAIQAYCVDNEIEIPLSLGNSSEDTEALEAKYEDAIRSAKENFQGEDLTLFFKENSINTQEEIDKWQEIANTCDTATEAKEKYLQAVTSEEEPVSYEALIKSAASASDAISEVRSSISSINDAFAEQAENGSISVDTMLSLAESGYATALQFDSVTGACTLNRDAMLVLVRAKIANQIYDLQSLRTDIATKLKNDGLIASESADGFLELAQAKAASATAEQLESVQDYNEASAQITTLENLVKSLDKTGAGGFPKDTGGSKSSSDPLRDAFTQEYNTLKHNLEIEYISEKEYYDSLTELNNKYFAGKSGYLDDYRKYEQEIYKGLQAYYKGYAESQMNLLEKQLDAGIINYQHYSSTVKSLLDSMYSDGKISAENYYSYTEKMLNRQKDFYDDALSAVTRRLDVEIDRWQKLIDDVEKENEALEEQKSKYDDVISAIQKVIQSKKDEVQSTIDALEDENEKIQEQVNEYGSVLRVVDKVYEAEIKSLQDQQTAVDDKISALREANNEEQRGIELEKAKNELARAQTQRTKYTFNGEQFVYTADQEAIRDAKDKISDLELEQTISNMEKEKEALQGTIDKLGEYRQKWAEIADTYQNAIDKSIAQNILGQDYDQTILLNRVEDVEAFKDRYVNAQTQMDDNTSMIESYQEKLLYYDSLSEKWSSIATMREESVNRELAAQLLGADWERQILEGRVVTFDGFKNQYLSIQDRLEDNTGLIASYEEKIVYYQGLKDQWSSISNAYKNSMEDQKAAMLLGADWEKKITDGRIDVLNDFRDKYSAIQQSLVDLAWESANEQIRAAQEAEKGAKGSAGSGKPVDKPSDRSPYPQPKPETNYNLLSAEERKEKVHNSGNKTGYVDRMAKGGIITSKSKSPLDSYASLFGEDHVILARNGERVLTQQQNASWEKLTKLLPDFLSVARSMPSFNIPAYDMVTVTKEEPLSISIGDVHIHEVRNPDALAETIVRELPNKMLQALNRRGM